MRSGGLVAFPTETVYGLGAAVDRPEALQRIFTVKGRPADNPLIVHIASMDQLYQVAVAVPGSALRLAERFWPGPLSLVLPRAPEVPALVSAGLSTVAVRMPDHPAAMALIEAAGVPVAAPSANLSGRPSPTTARHVLEDLAGKIEAVLDGGPCVVGVESTVLDMTGPEPVILRPGGVSREDLAATLGFAPCVARPVAGQAPLSPGMKYRHYSPRGRLILITGPPNRRRHLARRLLRYYLSRGVPAAHINPARCGPAGEEIAENPMVLARRLYAELRRCDLAGIRVILAEEIPACGIGAAVMNRLRKAAARVVRVGGQASRVPVIGLNTVRV